MRRQRYFYPIKKTTLATRIFRIIQMILVTGGTGLVGAHLLATLTSKNKQVKAIYRTEKSLQTVKKIFSYYTEDVATLFSKIIWVQADITEVPSLEKAFEEVTIVYHAAALVSFDPKDYRKMRQVNIDGTANIVNFCISNAIQKLCFVSSIAAIGDGVNNQIATEENEWNAEGEHNGYAITKRGAEMEVWRASQEGVEVVIVNPGVILGAGFWNTNTGLFFTKVAKGLKYYTTGITGYVGVADVVKAMILLTESSVKNERFILVSENKSFKEIFTTVALSLGKTPPSVNVSKSVISFLRRLDGIITFLTRKKRLLNKNTANSLFNETHYSSEKIRNSIDFKFTSIDKVIKEISNKYQEEH